MHELFGKVVHTYTRAQALEDGTLVNVTEWALAQTGFLGGFRWPVAVTAAVWADLNEIPTWAEGWQDVRGRAHDLLWMARIAVRQAGANATEVMFDLILSLSVDPEPADGRGEGEWGSMRSYKLVCGPNDDGSPCLTLMRLDED